MKPLLIASVLALTACATSEEFVAGRSDMTVCRFTLGGPHAAAADHEVRRRGLNCQAMYPAIQAQQANENAAVQNFLRSTQPAPAQRPRIVQCDSHRAGSTVQTTCY